MAGIDGGEVETVVADGLAAVVTRVSRPKIRAQRANLAAHHKLLQKMVERQEHPESRSRELDLDVGDLVFLEGDLLEGLLAAGFRVGHGATTGHSREEKKK